MARISTDPICFFRDENNDLVIPLRKATGPEAVLILVRTALKLWMAEYFLNLEIGMPWLDTDDGVVSEGEAILGQPYDHAKIVRATRRTILGTPGADNGIPGVVDITEIKSSFDNGERGATISCIVRTEFGDSPLTVTA